MPAAMFFRGLYHEPAKSLALLRRMHRQHAKVTTLAGDLDIDGSNNAARRIFGYEELAFLQHFSDLQFIGSRTFQKSFHRKGVIH